METAACPASRWTHPQTRHRRIDPAHPPSPTKPTETSCCAICRMHNPQAKSPAQCRSRTVERQVECAGLVLRADVPAQNGHNAGLETTSKSDRISYSRMQRSLKLRSFLVDTQFQGRSGGRSASCHAARGGKSEQDSGSTNANAFGDPRARWWLTTTGSNPRDSATENTQPTARRRSSEFRRDRAMVKRCGKSAPRRWRHRRQGKPHRLQDQAAGRQQRIPWALCPGGSAVLGPGMSGSGRRTGG